MDYPTRDEIRSLCTEQSFERGVNYHHQDRVQELEIDGDEIRATVRGSNYYDVVINLVDDAVRARCSCPYDYAGDCKHIVAVLLAVDDRDIETVSDTNPERDETVDVESLVEETTVEDLRTFLLDIVGDDRDIRDRFVAFASTGIQSQPLLRSSTSSSTGNWSSRLPLATPAEDTTEKSLTILRRRKGWSPKRGSRSSSIP